MYVTFINGLLPYIAHHITQCIALLALIAPCLMEHPIGMTSLGGTLPQDMSVNGFQTWAFGRMFFGRIRGVHLEGGGDKRLLPCRAGGEGGSKGLCHRRRSALRVEVKTLRQSDIHC